MSIDAPQAYYHVLEMQRLSHQLTRTRARVWLACLERLSLAEPERLKVTALSYDLRIARSAVAAALSWLCKQRVIREHGRDARGCRSLQLIDQGPHT